MGNFTADDITRVCAEVSRFGRKAGYMFKGLPAVQWEFPTVGDFARAKIEILQALSPMMGASLHSDAWQRTIDEFTFEVDCYAVTFRLVCRQSLALPMGGRVGAAEMVYASMCPSSTCRTTTRAIAPTPCSRRSRMRRSALRGSVAPMAASSSRCVVLVPTN